jgi:hypothetical protein
MWKNANNNAIRTKIRELTTNIIEMVRKGATVSKLWTIFKETLCTIINSNLWFIVYVTKQDVIDVLVMGVS